MRTIDVIGKFPEATPNGFKRTDGNSWDSDDEFE